MHDTRYNQDTSHSYIFLQTINAESTPPKPSLPSRVYAIVTLATQDEYITMSYPNLLPRNVTKNRNPRRFPHKLNDLHKHKSKSQDHNSSNTKDRFTPDK